VLGQQVAHQLAQRQVALGLAVAAQVGVLGGQRAQAAPHAFGKQPVPRQPAATGLEAQRAVLENALHVPHGIEAELRALCRGRLGRVGTAAHKKARVRARHEVALGHQSVVGVHHRIDAHAVGVGKLPDRRQLGPGAQTAVFDQLPETLDHLENQRRGGLGIQREHGIAGRTGTTKGLSVQAS